MRAILPISRAFKARKPTAPRSRGNSAKIFTANTPKNGNNFFLILARPEKEIVKFYYYW